MICQKCNSERVAEIFAHSRDCSAFVVPNEIDVEDDYFPKVPGICGGDDLQIKICLDCGQVQGAFPINKEDIKKD